MKVSCIYQIKNIINNKCYIGSTRDFANRKRVHLFDLKKQKHHSPYLQNAWNKYGGAAFIFECLEHCDERLLLEREQVWLDNSLPEYNILPRAGSLIGRKVSDESKRKISEARKGIPIPEEVRDKISKTLTGRTMPKESVLRSAQTRTGLKRGPMPQEFRAKIAKALKGRVNGPRSDEIKMKIAAAATGRRHSEQTKLRISLNRSGIGTGKRTSQTCEAIARSKAVLDEFQIRAIRRLCAAGLRHRDAGEMFGISKTTAGQIARLETYKWVAA